MDQGRRRRHQFRRTARFGPNPHSERGQNGRRIPHVLSRPRAAASKRGFKGLHPQCLLHRCRALGEGAGCQNGCGRGRRRALHLEPGRHSASGWPLPHVLRGEDRAGGRPSQGRNCEFCFRRRSGLGTRAGPAPSRSKRLLSGTSLSSPRPGRRAGRPPLSPLRQCLSLSRCCLQQQKHRQRSVRRWSSVRVGARRSHTPGPSFRNLCRLCPGGSAPRRGRLPHVLRRLDGGSRGTRWIKVSRQNLQRIFQGRSAVGQGSGNLH